MNRVPRSKRLRPPRLARRRGVAMLLVLVALATATVLSGAYVMSRRNAPAIGANAETSSNARWASKSGGNLAVAIMQTSLAVKGDLGDDQVVSGVNFGLGAADAVVTGFTGQAVEDGDYRLLISSIGSSGEIGALDQRMMIRRPTNNITEALDPSLREFALFATDRVRIESGSYVAPWPDSERGPSLFAANIGVAFGASNKFDTGGAGQLTAARLVVDNDATASLINVSQSATFAGGLSTGLQFPTASDRIPSALSSIGSSVLPLYVWVPGSTTTANRQGYGTALVTAGATLLLSSSFATDYAFDDLTMDYGGVLRISGHIRVLVRDDLAITDKSTIEFANDSSTLEIYVRDDLTITNSVVGLPKALAANTSRSYSNLSGVIDASALRIMLVDANGGGEAGQDVSIDTKSIIVGDISAPAATVVMNNNSLIIGRLAGADVRLRNTSIIFYDHDLNPGAGLTDPFGPLYDSDRYSTLRAALASFDNTHGVKTITQHVINAFTSAGIDPDPDEDGPLSASQPDPRDSAKVVVVPMRRGAARAIETGSSDMSLAGGSGVDSSSDLGKALGGAAGALRAGTADALEDLAGVFDLFGGN